LPQIYYIEAAKRLGIVYTPVFGGFSPKTLADRIADAGARVVITSDGSYRNAQIVPFKEAYTDQALDGYLPVGVAQDVVQTVLHSLEQNDFRFGCPLGVADLGLDAAQSKIQNPKLPRLYTKRLRARSRLSAPT
jgi:acyl-coenzyme A synthetase/AMP-(fatty) acid ligase